MNISTRCATVEDAAELLEIYRYYVENTAITFEYVTPSIEEFASRIANVKKSYPYIVAEIDGTIVGYAYASRFKGRAAYDWSIETSIYVARDMRGCGIGRIMHEALEKELAAIGILNMNACIAHAPVEDEYLTNASEAFHERLGYSLVGKFHQSGFKFKRWYDMVWMEKMIGEHTDNPRTIKIAER